MEQAEDSATSFYPLYR